jgi:hypothetical protein
MQRAECVQLLVSQPKYTENYIKDGLEKSRKEQKGFNLLQIGQRLQYSGEVGLDQLMQTIPAQVGFVRVFVWPCLNRSSRFWKLPSDPILVV